MRRFIFVCSLLFSFAAAAQEVRRPTRMLEMRPPSLQNYERLVQRLTASIKRDTFIVAQLVHAAAELQDFQKLAAVQKALDRVEAALKKAGEDPPASRQTVDILNGLVDALKHARQQGTMADTDALRTEIIKKTSFIQRELFMELDTARHEHQVITELATKLLQMGTELQSSMVEALGTTFDFTRAGGR